MNKTLKQLISSKKISDEDLLAFANAFNKEPESQSGSENSDAPDTPAGETADGNKDSFTMDELNEIIAKQVAVINKTKAQEQPSYVPKIDNKREGKPTYRVLKMNKD